MSGTFTVRHGNSYISLDVTHEDPVIESQGDLAYVEYILENGRGFDVVVGPNYEDPVVTIEVYGG